MGRDAVIIRDSIVRQVCTTLAEGKVHTPCIPGACVLNVSVQIPGILKGNECRIGRAACGGVRHQAAVDGDTEEGLQEPDRDGTQHIARDDDHCVRTSSHISTRTRKVQ